MPKPMIRDEGGYLILAFGGYDYEIAWSRIQSQEDLLAWVDHLAPKKWMDGPQVSQLIYFVMNAKGWKLRDP